MVEGRKKGDMEVVEVTSELYKRARKGAKGS